MNARFETGRRVETSLGSGTAVTFLIGCTGCGKGAVARALVPRVGGEIVSLDSMKVYRRMDIGTAKPPAELRRRIPHHLIDVVEPSEDFSVARYVELAEAAIADIRRRGKPVFVVGGTPLYLKAMLEGLFEGPGADPAIRRRLHDEAERIGSEGLHARLQKVDPQAADRIHPNDLRRIVRALEVYERTGRPISTLQAQWDRGSMRSDALLIGLRRARADQNHRTNLRVHRMIEAGWVDEVRALLAESKPLSRTARQALGYAELIEHLQGRLSLADAVEMIKIRTRRLSKAQRTWFRRFGRIEWTDLEADDDPRQVAERLLARYGARWSPSPR